MTNVQDIYPLSPMQQGMLFHSQLSTGSGMYFTQLSGTLKGRRRAEVFRQALERAMGRHAVLRTSFLWESLDEPLQVVHAGAVLPVEELDWSRLENDGEEFGKLLEADRRRGFDHGSAPLMRLTLVQCAGDEFRFIWSHHHILLDGWSFSLLMRELLLDCDALLSGREQSFPSARPYRDYVAWLQRQDSSAAEKYWRRTLAGFREPSFIAAEPRRGVEAGHGLCERTLPEALSARLTGAARRRQVTLNTMVQAAWALVLASASGKRDVVFGSVVSGRPAELPGVENMTGLFINVLPVRETLDGGQTVAAWLERMQASQLESRQFEYAALIDIQSWSELGRGTPLFDSIVVFENYPALSSAANVEDLRFFEKANYPVTLIARPGDRFELSINHDPRFVSNESARSLLERMETVLDQLAADETRTLGEIQLAAAGLSNDTATAYPKDKSAAALFEARAAEDPEAIAVSFGGRVLTRGELNRQANQMAHLLRQCGVRTGSAVALFLNRSIESVVATLAVVKAGGVYVPLDPGYPQERLRFMLADTQAPVLITTAEFEGRLPAYSGTILCLDCDAATLDAQPAGNLDVPVSGDDIAYLMYTSGSTGKPKGIAIRHGSIARLILNTNYIQLESSDRVAHVSNPCFDAATFEIWGALFSGACLIGIDKDVALSPADFAAQLRTGRVTTVFLTTALFNRLAADTPEVFGTLRHVLFGGESCDVNSIRRVLEHGKPQHLLHVYGPTESTTFATWFEIESMAATATTAPIGRALSNTTLHVLDSTMQPVPTGVVAELYIGGDGLATGYASRPDLTAAAFVPNPFGPEPGSRLYRTGDLVRCLEDGVLEFAGRVDHQVKIRGFRIEPGEVEAVLRQHSGVTECAVIVREDKPGEKRLVAYFASHDGVTAPELRAWARASMPEYMVPAAWTAVPQLPLNSNGKVDRAALPAPDFSGGGEDHVHPRNAVQKIAADICAEVLSLDRVSVTANFFDLGGHSLLATQFISRLREVFQVEIPLRHAFEHATVAELCEALMREPGQRERLEATAEVLLEVDALPAA